MSVDKLPQVRVDRLVEDELTQAVDLILEAILKRGEPGSDRPGSTHWLVTAHVTYFAEHRGGDAWLVGAETAGDMVRLGLGIARPK